jgi:hypothetical protein
MYLCTCERVAEKGDFGSCFRGPFHRTQPAALTFFWPQAPRVLKLCPKNGSLSIYSVGHGWRYISFIVCATSVKCRVLRTLYSDIRQSRERNPAACWVSVGPLRPTACPSSSLAFYLRRYILVTVAITIAIGAAARLTRNAVRYLGLE